jgi:hypothetical protein
MALYDARRKSRDEARVRVPSDATSQDFNLFLCERQSTNLAAQRKAELRRDRRDASPVIPRELLRFGDHRNATRAVDSGRRLGEKLVLCGAFLDRATS